jgi:hypothetical protein
MSDDTIIVLRGLPPVALEYTPGDDEIIIASDALAAKGLVARPITGRGYPRAIRWRKAKRDKAHRAKPERKRTNARSQKAYHARKKIEEPAVYKAERKARRPAERKRYAVKLKERNLSGHFVAIDAEGCDTGVTSSPFPTFRLIFHCFSKPTLASVAEICELVTHDLPAAFIIAAAYWFVSHHRQVAPCQKTLEQSLEECPHGQANLGAEAEHKIEFTVAFGLLPETTRQSLAHLVEGVVMPLGRAREGVRVA